MANNVRIRASVEDKASTPLKGISSKFDDLAAKGDRAVGLGPKLKAAFSKENLAVAGVVGLTVAFAALTAGVVDGFRSLIELERLNAQTDAAIKSTGAAAHVTRDEIVGLAESTEKLTGVQREGIQEGQNFLLTFTNIRNEVGAGNAIYDRATAAMVDMSVALGTDAKSAALQLGKALNDPIAGMTALTRSGVSFTAQQKEQVRALVQSGKLLEAQKLILGELNKEFGGSAEAFGNTTAGKLQRFGNGVGDIFEGIATSIVDTGDEIGKLGNDWAMNFGDMGDRVHRLADRSGVDFTRIKEYIRTRMAATGESFADAADAADDEFGAISKSTKQLVTESGAAWDTYQSQIRVTGDVVRSEVRGFTGSIVEKMEEGRIHVVDVALRMPGDMAQALRDGREEWKQALVQLQTDVEEQGDKASRIAALKAALVGDELVAGLASKDPLIHEQAVHAYTLIQEQLAQEGAYGWGSAIAKAWADGLASQWGYAHAKAVYLGTSTSGPLKGESPPKEGPLRDIDKWGENIGKAWADGLAKGASGGLNLLPGLSSAGVTAGPGGGGAAGGAGGSNVIQLVVDGRVLAEVVDRHLYYMQPRDSVLPR